MDGKEEQIDSRFEISRHRSDPKCVVTEGKEVKVAMAIFCSV